MSDDWAKGGKARRIAKRAMPRVSEEEGRRLMAEATKIPAFAEIAEAVDRAVRGK